MEKKLFNYNVIKVLGEGGMSRVYLGEDPATNQQVAIKELLPNLAHSKDLRERFRREAQIMAKLDHPNIVKLLKFEETATSFYLIMEYVDGMDLEQHIKEVTGPISEPKAIEIMSTLLDAFGYAHEKAVVHRDIKPANIIITRDGKVKVLDFGIAKIVDENASGRTQTGTRIGTVAYMSPEQVNAAPDIDLRTDIYSLGVMLHQIITGKAAYDTATSSDFEVQTLIVKEPLARANSIYPYASDHLQKLIDKATQKKRENRFHDCDQFKLAMLKKYNVPVEPIPPIEPSVPNKEPEGSTTNWFVVGLIVFIIIALLAITLNNQSPKTTEIAPAVDSTMVAVDTVTAVDETEITANEGSENGADSQNTLDNLSFLRNLNGKYPYEVELLDNKILAGRLYELIGDRFSFLKKKWNVETPIEISDNIFIASACEAHNCGYTEFIIVINFTNDVLYVGIREEGKVDLYSENGVSCQQLDNWSGNQ